MKKEVTPQDIEKLRKSTVDLHPAFPENNVALAVFCSREYLPIAATTLQSVIAYTSFQRNYDLLIVSPEVSDEEKNEIQSLVKGRENCSIRIVDGTPFMELLHQGLRQENFWYNLHECLRLYVPFVCRNYEKVVCLAADVIVQTDIAEFYDTELGDHFLAACSGFSRPYTRRKEALLKMCPQPWEMEDVNSWRMPPNIYCVKVGISKEHPGFNGDVLLLNIPLLAKENFFEEALNSLFRERWRTLSEAVYMKLLKQRRIKLGMEWNLQSSPDPYDQWGGALDDDEAEEYAGLVRRAKIFHFAGLANKKPWVNPAAPLGWLWWRYARETPFYEQLLSTTFETMLRTHSQGTEACAMKMFNEWRKIPSLKRKMRFLRVVRQFTFGRTRRRLKEKEWALKTRIREFRSLIR